MIALATAQPAHAQIARENVITDAEDGFGTTAGQESSGIYNENDTRGLSPIKAGNARIDGVYFDPVQTISQRLRSSYAIRVGAAALFYPFPAPTGVVDSHLRSAGHSFSWNLGITRQALGGSFYELDMQVPLVKDHLSLAVGGSRSVLRTSDGGETPAASFLVKPVIRIGGAQISPFYSPVFVSNQRLRPFFLVAGGIVPPIPETSHFLGQTWAKGRSFHATYGVTARIPLTDRLVFQGGLFRTSQLKIHNYTEVFRFAAPGPIATHSLISDPRQATVSRSGEGQLQLRLDPVGGLRHRLLAGVRARDRQTESGGSAPRLDLGLIDINGYDPEPEPAFTYSPVNSGRVRQASAMVGYQARLTGVGRANLGLQRVRYRASFVNAQTGERTTAREDTWVYNALFAVNLTEHVELFAGTETGLEDSGAAPENASNRNEQLPTTRSTQYEGGVHVKVGKSTLIASLFQISRPYFAFDAANRYVEFGTARYRGAELSINAHLPRLTILAGGVYTKSEVSGPGRDSGILGPHVVGIPDFRARLDAQYRLPLLGGITPTFGISYTGHRAVGSAPVAALGGRQLELPPATTVDLGVRYQFTAGKVPMNFRANLYNIFDNASWKVVASNTLQVEERRRFIAALSAGF